MNPVKAIIVDIDGTLADCKHRLHHVGKQPINWDAFFAEMADDSLIYPVAFLANAMFDACTPVILCSGRPEDYRAVTEAWLAQHGVRYSTLHMRAKGDHRADTLVKKQMLEYIRAEGIYEPILAIDDRPSIVSLWRDEGLVCLANEWHGEAAKVPSRAPLLTLMVGPSGAGKSTWIKMAYGEYPTSVVSSDCIRQEICNDWRDQTKNDEVFAAVHSLVKARLWVGLDVVVDATNLRNRDRRAITDLAPPNAKIKYIVINRPMEEKRRDGGWRNGLGFDLLAKHEQTFNSNLKEILAGDHLPNVTVKDLRAR